MESLQDNQKELNTNALKQQLQNEIQKQGMKALQQLGILDQLPPDARAKIDGPTGKDGPIGTVGVVGEPGLPGRRPNALPGQVLVYDEHGNMAFKYKDEYYNPAYDTEEVDDSLAPSNPLSSMLLNSLKKVGHHVSEVKDDPGTNVTTNKLMPISMNELYQVVPNQYIQAAIDDLEDFIRNEHGTKKQV